MRVVVDRQTIRIHRQHTFDRSIETHHRLVRQAIDQINRYRLEAVGPRVPNHAVGLFFTLHAVDGKLHTLIEILNTDAHTVETEFAEQGNRCCIHFARINFD